MRSLVACPHHGERRSGGCDGLPAGWACGPLADPMEPQVREVGFRSTRGGGRSVRGRVNHLALALPRCLTCVVPPLAASHTTRHLNAPPWDLKVPLGDLKVAPPSGVWNVPGAFKSGPIPTGGSFCKVPPLTAGGWVCCNAPLGILFVGCPEDVPGPLWRSFTPLKQLCNRAPDCR